MKHYVAVDNVCAWPNLSVLPNGDFVAVIFNQPCHGLWQGDVECWASTDGGEMWRKRGDVTRHEPDTNRMNVSAGLAPNGDLIALVSGWSHKVPLGEYDTSRGRDPNSRTLRPWVCRSRDGGAVWNRESELSDLDAIPFGDIVVGSEGRMISSVYSHPIHDALVIESSDDGATWSESRPISSDDDHNETDLLVLGEGRMLAASRTKDDEHLDLFVSGDGGKSWSYDTALTGPHMHPAHLLLLADGRVLVTYGIRFRGLYGVGARIMKEGSWSRPLILTDFGPATDGGYPSSAQRPDGAIATAWYANRSSMHDRYHMGVTVWNPAELGE